MFRHWLNFTTECIGGQIKAFSFLFCTTCTARRERVNIQNNYKTIGKKRTGK